MIKRLIKKIFGQYFASRIAAMLCIIPNGICSLFPMRKEILLESKPDFACNTYELYRYFLKKGLNKEYRIVWRVSTPELYTDNKPENVYYIKEYPTGLASRIRNYIRCNRALVSISCNMNLPRYKTSRKQLNIYLDHGSQLKSMKSKDGKRAPLSCDYLVSQSAFFIPYHIQEYTLNKNQIICTGLPRDDQFYRLNESINKLIPEVNKYKKTIIWTPTFRIHKNGYRVDCHYDYPYGLPFLFSEKDINQLEKCLIEENILLIIKPHPAQNLDSFKIQNRRNTIIITNDVLSEHNIQINELLSQTDAMITDYSSIYYDYLFVKKPLALTLDDYHAYENEKGFVFDNPLDVLKGEMLYSLSDLCLFIKNVSKGIDNHYEERQRLHELINDFDDGNSSERVYTFICNKLKHHND